MKPRTLTKLTRYSRVYSRNINRNAVEILTSKQVQAWSTGATLLSVPLILKGYLDAMLPFIETLKEIQNKISETLFLGL